MIKFNYFLDKKFHEEITYEKSIELKRMVQDGKNIKPFLNKNETSLYLAFRIDGKYFKVRTPEKVLPLHWDQKAQRVKSSHPHSVEINMNLSSLKLETEKRFRNLLLNSDENTRVTAEKIKSTIKEIIENKQPIAKSDDFFQVFDQFLIQKKPFFKPNNVKKYGTLKNHLLFFQKASSSIKFELIDEHFLERFEVHLLGVGQNGDVKNPLKNNSIAKLLSNTKAFLRWSADNGYLKNSSALKHKIKYDATDFVYLTKEEFLKILNMDLSQNKVLAEVRDTFCFQTLTGARYSDIRTLHWGSILRKEDGLVWECYQQKGNKSEKVTIPISAIAEEILERYPCMDSEMKDSYGKHIHQSVLPVRCDQVMNRHLKKIAKMAGLNEVIVQVKYSGKKRLEITKRKWEMITTHTARRSFVTLSLELGMRPEVVMACTGHTDVRMMRKYLRITDKVKSQEHKNVWKITSDPQSK